MYHADQIFRTAADAEGEVCMCVFNNRLGNRHADQIFRTTAYAEGEVWIK